MKSTCYHNWSRLLARHLLYISGSADGAVLPFVGPWGKYIYMSSEQAKTSAMKWASLLYIILRKV